MRFLRSEIAAAVGGTLNGPDGVVDGASIDSRSIAAGMMFVPLVADRDGHDFLDAAIAGGADTWLTSRPGAAAGAIVVANTTDALKALGSYARSRLPERVIGITGSTGKTSTKDLTAAITTRHGESAASEKSFNNELGVPLTLINAHDGALSAVIEMGARGPGHIAALCAIARPTVGIVTNIGTAHRELFKSARATAVAKAELLDALPPGGTGVLNRDDAMFDLLRSHVACDLLVCSVERPHGADIGAHQVAVDNELHASFRLRTPWGDGEVRLGTRGRHQVSNALAAAAAALTVGCSLDEVIAGLSSTRHSPWRMEMVEAGNGARVLNDAYNANPASMLAAIDSLCEMPASRRIAVIGTMAELGDDADLFHREIGGTLRDRSIDVVIAVDEAGYGLPPVAGVAGALAALAEAGFPRPGDVVLVKGSRVAGLERVVAALADQATRPGSTA